MESRIYYGEYSLRRWIDLMLSRKIILPEYQRSFVWNEKDLKRLIKSIKDGQFIPPVTIALYDLGGNKTNLILDGQQRLTSILLAFLGFFPDKSKFEEREEFYASEDDSERDDGDAHNEEGVSERVAQQSIPWTFSKLLEYGSNKEKIVSVIKGNVNYQKLEIKEIDLNDEFWDSNFIGFSYVLANDSDEEKIKSYFTQLFRNMNYLGHKLSNMESRKSLYYQDPKLTKYFEGKTNTNEDVLCGLRIKQDFQNNKIDFVRYLSILSQKVVDLEPMVGYSAYKSRENFYADYVSYILGLEQEDRHDKFNGFIYNDYFSGDILNQRFQQFKQDIDRLIPYMTLSNSTFSSYSEADYWLFGLMYWIVFKGKQLNPDKLDELKEQLNSKIQETRDDSYSKNSNRVGKIRSRVNESIAIYENCIL